MILMVKVIPNARKSEWVGWEGDVLKIRIQAPPDKGKANDALIEFLSNYWSIAKTKIRILSGHTGRLKRLEITEENLPLHKKTGST